MIPRQSQENYSSRLNSTGRLTRGQRRDRVFGLLSSSQLSAADIQVLGRARVWQMVTVAISAL